jgi:dTDP-4-amino-4,6-dideoxygalactose transaminase
MQVPFLDLKAQYESIKDEVDHAIQQVLKSCAFAGGPFVEKFEREYADFCDCAHAVGVGSGTEALWLTLLAMGVGPGDEVITVPNTFIATAEAISFCGAYPVFVDVDENTYNMDPVKLKEFLEFHCQQGHVSDNMVNLSTGRNVKAVIPVHLYGLMADMDPIMEIAGEYGVQVVEDASQAHGASYNGRRAGSIGHAGCFSFYPGKNLGAYGEAGAVVTSNGDLADRIKMLRDHGQPQKYMHDAIGWNGRMDGIQGAVLSVKLRSIEGWNAARRMVADQYTQNLSGLDSITCPENSNNYQHAYHIYAVLVPDRTSFMDAMARKGIATAIHYPVPIHLQEAYRFLPLEQGAFPIAEQCAKKVVSLPMFPELHFRQVARVIEAVREIQLGPGKIHHENALYA